ncbi:MAG: hypothetical protein PHQ36_02605 [Anaerolineales bacterium]|nr:hypothetical protein [Anaerolineales bacterium]
MRLEKYTHPIKGIYQMNAITSSEITNLRTQHLRQAGVSLIVMDHILGRSPYSADYYIEKLFPTWRHVAEWAPAQVLEQESRRLSQVIQVITVIGILIVLLVFLTIIGSEMNAAVAQTSIPNLINASCHLYQFF